MSFVGQKGYQREPELDLYLLHRRHYDPATGRFLREDPLGYRAGDLNLYRYAKNNPLRWIDPTGNMPECGNEPKPTSEWGPKIWHDLYFNGDKGQAGDRFNTNEHRNIIGPQNNSKTKSVCATENVFLVTNYEDALGRIAEHERQAQQTQQSGDVVDRFLDWIFSGIKAIFNFIAGIIGRIASAFLSILGPALDFFGFSIKDAISWLLEKANINPKRFWENVSVLRDALQKIWDDALGIISRLLKGTIEGIKGFFAEIGNNIVQGFVKMIFPNGTPTLPKKITDLEGWKNRRATKTERLTSCLPHERGGEPFRDPRKRCDGMSSPRAWG